MHAVTSSSVRAPGPALLFFALAQVTYARLHIQHVERQRNPNCPAAGTCTYRPFNARAGRTELTRTYVSFFFFFFFCPRRRTLDRCFFFLTRACMHAACRPETTTQRWNYVPRVCTYVRETREIHPSKNLDCRSDPFLLMN
jgi:hypothetical protein